MRGFLLVCLLPISVFAVEKKVDHVEMRVDRTISERENYFQTSTPYRIAPNVNPITGDLIEEEADLIVEGIQPLSVRRFYNHTALYEARSGGWRFNPESYFVANFEWSKQEIFAAVGDADGGIRSFKPSSTPYSYIFDSKGFIAL